MKVVVEAQQGNEYVILPDDIMNFYHRPEWDVK